MEGKHHEEGVVGRVTGIENKLAIMDYRLGSNESVLKEISESVKQLVALHQEQRAIRDDFRELKESVEKKHNDIDPIITNSHKMQGTVFGAGLVLSLLIAVLSYVSVETLNDIRTLSDKQAGLETAVQVMKSELRSVGKTTSTTP